MNCIALLWLLLCGGNQGRCANPGKDRCVTRDCPEDSNRCSEREGDCHTDKRDDCRRREMEQECDRNKGWERAGNQESCECRDMKPGMMPPPWNNRTDAYEAGRQNGCGCEERE